MVLGGAGPGACAFVLSEMALVDASKSASLHWPAVGRGTLQHLKFEDTPDLGMPKIMQ